MNKIELKKIDETLYYEKSEAGLDVYMLPNKNVNNYYLTLNVNYGSIHTEFKSKGDKSFNKVPNGIAHFLEHMMFYMPDGHTAHEFYNKTGAYINAATSYRLTFYEVLASTFFKENLDYLLKYVFMPCFKKDYIESEKKIIEEEINMGNDKVGTRINYEIQDMIFNNYKMKYKVAGKKEDITKINADNLSLVYNTFYQPSNMFLIITGNFNPTEAMAIINNTLKEFAFDEPKEIILKKQKEIDKLACCERKINVNVKTPRISIFYKIPHSIFNELNLENYELGIYLSFILQYNLGTNSELNQRLLTEKIIKSSIGISCSTMKEKEYVIIKFMAQTEYYDETKKLILDKLNNLTFDDKFFIRRKRCYTASIITETDNIEIMNSNIANDLIIEEKVVDDWFNRIEKLNIKKVKALLNVLKFNNEGVLISLPYEKKIDD